MARIRRFEKGSQGVRVHPTEVDCFYQVIVDRDGSRHLHLSTFGSDMRQSAPKSSQSIQLDEKSARDLISILRAAFPGVS